VVQPTYPTATVASAELERRRRLREREQRARWQHDPVAFAAEALGLTVWSRMRDMLEAVRDHRRVAIRSGHKVGKSSACSALALWWSWRGGNVVATAPTHNLVKDVFWAELRRLARDARARGIWLPDPAREPATGLEWPDGRRIYGYSTDAPERFAVRGTDLLFLVDEASGVHEGIFEALKGQSASGAHIVLVGNPTQPAGTFADAFARNAEHWHTLHISSTDSPNLTGEAAIPGLATRQWVDDCRGEWGEDSPLYHVRVLGNFAAANEACIIPAHLVHAAVQRWDAAHLGVGALHVGVDVARFGDDSSVACARRGNVVVALHAVHGFDEHAVAQMTIGFIAQHRQPGERCFVKVDACGVGLGVASILRQHEGARDEWLTVIEVDAAAKGSDEFPNLRSQLWFAMADWLRGGGAIPDDKALAAELTAPRYSFDAQGRRVAEKKEQFKQRLKRSPDRADALALSVYQAGGIAPVVHVPRKTMPGSNRWATAAGRGFG
jgi:hypothetical protein